MSTGRIVGMNRNKQNTRDLLHIMDQGENTYTRNDVNYRTQIKAFQTAHDANGLVMDEKHFDGFKLANKSPFRFGYSLRGGGTQSNMRT